MRELITKVLEGALTNKDYDREAKFFVAARPEDVDQGGLAPSVQLL